MSLEENLLDAIIDLDEQKSYSLVEKLLAEGQNPNRIIELLRKGMDVIGERYSNKEYFLTELVMSGEIFQGSIKILGPALEKGRKNEKPLGVVVVGTVKGDVHDIGKNIFITLLQSAGFEVYDLGVDIKAEDCVEKVKDTNADIVGYSGLLTIALESMKKTTEALRSAGLRDKLKIIIGGLPTDEMCMKKVGADAFTDNAYEGVKIIKKWVGGAI